jgi:hypothetical protein
MSHSRLLIVLASLLVTWLGSANVSQAGPILEGESGYPTMPAFRPLEWSVSELSCKPEAARSIEELKRIEAELGKLKWVLRHRKFIESDRRVPFYFFFVAVRPVKESYQKYGIQGLPRGFHGDLFFEKNISWGVLRPKLETQYGIGLKQDEAYRWFWQETGIPKGFAFGDFFDRYVWGSAARHAAHLFHEFETKEVTPLKERGAKIIASLESSGQCRRQKPQNAASLHGDCKQRLAQANVLMESEATQVEGLLKGLADAYNAADLQKYVLQIRKIIDRWKPVAESYRKDCPELARSVDITCQRWEKEAKKAVDAAIRRGY